MFNWTPGSMNAPLSNCYQFSTQRRW